MDQKLITIYNMLSQIRTSGEDTIYMGTALVEIRNMIVELQTQHESCDNTVLE